MAIPNRPVFRAQEVCEIADVPAYVLRTWEAEFADLGVAKTTGGPRVYRRPDVERVLRIKHLLFVDGLTLAGARRRLGEEVPAPQGVPVSDAEVAALVDGETKQQLREVRRGLQWILGLLVGEGATASDFVLTTSPALAVSSGSSTKVGKPAGREKVSKPVKKAGKKK